MTDYASKALLLYAPEAVGLYDKLQANPQGCAITPQPLEEFYISPGKYLADYQHVIVSASLPAIKEVLKLSVEYNFSLGIIPLKGDKKLAIALDLPATLDESVDLALRADPLPMDLVLCNGHILLFNGIIGWIPALDAPRDMSKVEVVFRALRRYGRLRLRPFTVRTAQEKTVKTAASGCMLLQRHEGDYVSNLPGVDASVRDGTIGLVVCSPFSVVGYLRFLRQVFIKFGEKKSLPAGIGYIKSQSLDIDTPEPMDVIIDGEKLTETPLHCETLPAVARVNIGPKLADEKTSTDKETFKTNNLPDEKEAQKPIENGIPFFSYASEERFKDLFLLLNDDARINSHYIVLTLLSTLLAAVGLYLNSAAVIIGAMILAPLMAPLVSFAMGLLRGNRAMLFSSLEKLAAGVLLALFASALFSLPFTHKPVTSEMMARLNPTLLDLAVAILSGIAAAYSKAFKEIAQTLAGVAIAVALVPPLSVAGIGIARGDLAFFFQAFLLFLTNLVGIILAATFTFRVLGFSSAVMARRGVILMTLLTLVIAVPLYVSYNQIVDRLVFERNLETDRFLVNGKYMMIRKAHMARRGEYLMLDLEILAREPLDRESLSQLKQKLQSQFNEKLIVKTDVSYML